MNSKQFQFNRRQVISLLLAILVLAASATPVLAWLDEGGENFQSAHTMTATGHATGGGVDNSEASGYPIGLLKAEGW